MVPLVLAGWSFGADMALATVEDRIAGWLAIAPPLRFAGATGYDAVAHDPRPKLLVLGQHDEFRDPASVVEETEPWASTEIEVIAGASHFFVGRTDRVVEAAAWLRGPRRRHVGDLSGRREPARRAGRVTAGSTR